MGLSFSSPVGLIKYKPLASLIAALPLTLTSSGLRRSDGVPCEAFGQAQPVAGVPPNRIYRFDRGTGVTCAETDHWALDAEVDLGAAYADQNLVHPFLTADGLTLLIVLAPTAPAPSTILELRRRTVDDAFGAPTVLRDLAGASLEGVFPSLTDDRLDLFLENSTAVRIDHFHRTNADAGFGAARSARGMASRPIFVAGTQEVFGRMFRGRYWRGDETPHPLIELACPPSGYRSYDHLRCITQPTAAPSAWSETLCGAGPGATSQEGPHLASVPSFVVLMGLTPDGAWTGLYEPVDGSPPVWTSGQTVRATDTTEGSIPGAGCYFYASAVRTMREDACSTPRAFLCETELWPTWTPWVP